MDALTESGFPVAQPTEPAMTKARRHCGRPWLRRQSRLSAGILHFGKPLAASLLAAFSLPALSAIALAQPRHTVFLPLLETLAWPQASPSPSMEPEPSPSPEPRPSPSPSPEAQPSPSPLPEPGPSPLPEEIRWIGEMGGAAFAVAASGQAAYLGEGHRLVTVDLSDPRRPHRAAERGHFPGYVQDLIITDGHAFVAAGEGGLWIMDLADPLAPRDAGALETPGDARSVLVSAHLAYVADGLGGLRIVDISEPAAPRLVGVLDTGQAANDVAIRGNLAYVTVGGPGSAGLLVVDLSDPTRPRELGALATTGGAHAVAINGALAYIANGSGGLVVADVSDSTNPRLLAVTMIDRAPIDVLVGPDAAYVIGLAGQVWVADISDPASPKQNGRSLTDRNVADMALDEGRLVMADIDEGLVIYTLAQGGLPEPQRALDSPGPWADYVAVSGDHAYVTWQQDLRVMDVSDPTDPRAVGWLDKVGLNLGPVVIHGHYAYIPTTPDGLRIVDVSDPASPRRVPDAVSPVAGFFSLAIAGTQAYIVQSMQLLVLDLARPELPVRAGGLAIPSDSEWVAVDGDRAYVATSSFGDLVAIDIADSRRPRLLGSLPVDGPVSALQASGPLAYLADPRGALRVVDVSNPVAMRHLGQVSLPPQTQDVAVSGSRVFLANGPDGIQVVDVSNPSLPRLAAVFDTQGYARKVAVVGAYLYVADGAGGLQVFQVASMGLPPIRAIGARDRWPKHTAR